MSKKEQKQNNQQNRNESEQKQNSQQSCPTDNKE